ncbi:hypothetical protein GINT2_001793 [Glugoides intestinalis]
METMVSSSNNTQKVISVWQDLILSNQPGALHTTVLFIEISIAILFIMTLLKEKEKEEKYYYNNLSNSCLTILLTIISGTIFGKGLEILFRTLHIFSGAYGNVVFSLDDIFISLLFGSIFVISGYCLLFNKKLYKLLKLEKSEDAQTIIDTQPKEIVDFTGLNVGQQPNEENTKLNEENAELKKMLNSTTKELDHFKKNFEQLNEENTKLNEENAELNVMLEKQKSVLESALEKLNSLSTTFEETNQENIKFKKMLDIHQVLLKHIRIKFISQKNMCEKFKDLFDNRLFPKLDKFQPMLDAFEKASCEAFEKVGLGEIMLELKSIVNGDEKKQQNPKEIVTCLGEIMLELESIVNGDEKKQQNPKEIVTYLEKKLPALDRILSNYNTANSTEINQIVLKLKAYKAPIVDELNKNKEAIIKAGEAGEAAKERAGKAAEAAKERAGKAAEAAK